MTPGKNSVTLLHLQIHRMQFTNLPQVKEKGAKPCQLYKKTRQIINNRH
jgi:hypothetical protein